MHCCPQNTHKLCIYVQFVCMACILCVISISLRLNGASSYSTFWPYSFHLFSSFLAINYFILTTACCYVACNAIRIIRLAACLLACRGYILYKILYGNGLVQRFCVVCIRFLCFFFFISFDTHTIKIQCAFVFRCSIECEHTTFLSQCVRCCCCIRSIRKLLDLFDSE